MYRIVLMAFILAGCRAMSPQTIETIEKDAMDIENTVIQSETESMHRQSKTLDDGLRIKK